MLCVCGKFLVRVRMVLRIAACPRCRGEAATRVCRCAASRGRAWVARTDVSCTHKRGWPLTTGACVRAYGYIDATTRVVGWCGWDVPGAPVVRRQVVQSCR